MVGHPTIGASASGSGDPAEPKKEGVMTLDKFLRKHKREIDQTIRAQGGGGSTMPNAACGYSMMRGSICGRGAWGLWRMRDSSSRRRSHATIPAKRQSPTLDARLQGLSVPGAG